jgi:hypothetical protein
MLETPIFGRYGREERTLSFAPTPFYMGFVYATVVLGFGSFIWTFFFDGTERFYVPWLWLMVLVAGIYGFFSIPRIIFDLRKRSYARYLGSRSFLPRMWRGPIEQLDAVVVIAEAPMLGRVKVHITLHWKNRLAPPAVLETDAILISGGPVQAVTRNTVARATRYAASLQLPVYDNTHFPSPNPLGRF